MDCHSEHLDGIRPPLNTTLLTGLPPQQQDALIMQNNESQDSRDKLLSNLRPKTALIVGNEGLDTANAPY